MGDINLLGMIRKIKNSLSGFVSTSDKATKSKFGIVKVGDNLSVSSGTISVPVATAETYGVVKDTGGGGVTLTKIGELDAPLNGAGSKDIVCSDALDSYNGIIVYATNNDGQGGSTFIPIDAFMSNTNYTLAMWSNSGSVGNCFVKLNTTDETKKTITLYCANGVRVVTCKIYAI